jgi:hypothetical protein
MARSRLPNAALFLTSAVCCFTAPNLLFAAMTIPDITDNVRRNEALFANIDVTLRSVYSIGDRTPPTLKGGTIARESNTTLHYVAQGEMFRLDRIGAALTAESERNEGRVQAFDGAITRRFEQNRIGNLGFIR